ncbi:MAG: hypothetical protein NNA20_03755 [Nitrospira sp.]|nr:hypothetical protein [Nitrospira sp.]MCP9441687.1 hypothetical protein [Nitrospira sp.]
MVVIEELEGFCGFFEHRPGAGNDQGPRRINGNRQRQRPVWSPARFNDDGVERMFGRFSLKSGGIAHNGDRCVTQRTLQLRLEFAVCGQHKDCKHW